jgi:neocarzinostatin family protein
MRVTRVSISAVAAALALVGGLVGAGVASAAHESPRTGPTVVVTPSTGLTNGQVVMVSGSGFNPGDSVFILQCQNPPTGQSSCNVGGVVPATIDGSGNLPSTSFTVKTGVYGTTTCGTSSSDASNCVIEVGNIAETDVGAAPITFAAPSTTTTTTPTSSTTTTTPTATTTTTLLISPAPRRLAVAPSTSLRNNEHVTVTGSGFTPGDHVFVIECRRGATGQKGCDLATLKAVTVSSSGHLPRTTFKVVTGKVGNGRCGTSRANRASCDVSVGNALGKDAATHGIVFKP